MATINNIKGTSYQSFLIGKRGTTVYQGSDVPSNVVTAPSNGDVYFQKGLSTTDQGIWQYINSAWIKLQVESANLIDISKITKTANSIIGVDPTGTSIVSLSPSQIETNLGLGSAAYLSTGTSAGNIPVLDSTGKIPVSTLPSIAISDVYSVADVDARNALSAHEGDIAIVTSDSTSYIYDGSDWQTIGSAGSVTGIEGANSSVKTGVVSLDTSDLLTGTLPVVRGGTGLSSISQGDLLIGSTGNTISALTKSSDGNSLITSEGNIVWGKPDGTNISFSASNTGLASTDVNSAINEVASTRARITLVTSDPWPGTDSTAGYNVGDIIINTKTDKIFQALDVTAKAAVWQKMGSTVNPENTVYVSLSGDDNNGDGSASFPYKTISQAITKSSSGGAILIFPGTYNEDVTTPTSNIIIKSMSGNVTIGGKFKTTVDNITLDNIKFAVVNSSTPSIAISANSNVVFNNCSTDSSTPITISGATGTGISFISCEILGTITMSSTSSNPVTLRDSYGFGISMTSGTMIVASSRTTQTITHSGGMLYLNDIVQVLKNTNGDSIISSASNGTGNFLYVVNSSLLQNDMTYGKISITGGTSYIVDNVVYDPTLVLPDSGRIYSSLSKDVGVQGTFTNFASGSNVQSSLESIDAKLGTISGAAVKKYSGLTDVTPYTTDDSNKVVQVNSTGTGLTYGTVLGTASTNNTGDFATAAQGNLASSAVQPNSLAKVATSGLFSDLTDSPGIMGTTNVSKVLRVNADGTSLEYGPTLSKVASTGKYSDLSGTPVLGTASANNTGDFATSAQGAKADTAVQPGSLSTVASSGKYSDLSGTPVLSTVATSGSYTDLSNQPSLKPVATEGFFTSLGDTPKSMTSDDIGKVIRVSSAGDSLEYGPVLSTIASTGSYSDLTNAPVLSTVATSGSYSDLSNKPVLGTASASAASDFATSAQGSKADTAVQPGSLSTVATSGKYSDLSGLPTLGTASANNTGDFATSAQGAKADTAVQPSGLSKVATTGSYSDLTNLPVIDNSVSSLTDVTLTNISTNDVLVYNGTTWYNRKSSTRSVTVITDDTTITNVSDTVIVRKSTGSATTITLPAGSSFEEGQVVQFKDGKGDATTNNITIKANGSDVIDGASSVILSEGYAAVSILWDGSNWNIV